MQLARGRDEPRVGCEDPVDVRVHLARIGAERRGERDRRQIRAAPTQRGDVIGGRDALKPGDEDDPVGVQRLVNAPRADVHDLGAVHRVRDDSRLRARQ